MPILPTRTMTSMAQTGKINPVGKKAEPVALDYNPITKPGTKVVDTTRVIRKKVKPPRDIPNSGINERARFLKKHPEGLFKEIKKGGKKKVTARLTDTLGSKMKFQKAFAQNMKQFAELEGKAKSGAAARRAAAMKAFESQVGSLQAGEGKLKEKYIGRGLGSSGILQKALGDYQKQTGAQRAKFQKDRDSQINAAAMFEKQGLSKAAKGRSGESARYKAALKRLGK